MTPREVRAARSFLGWTRQKLATKAMVGLNSVIRFEQGVSDARLSTANAIQDALEKAGIQFLSASEMAEGIRANARPAKRTKRK